MARMSYGADMFSPVRGDTSIEEKSKSGRDSDIFFKQLKEFTKDNKKESFSKESHSPRKQSSSENLTLEVKSGESLFKNSDSSKSKSFITTRKKSSGHGMNSTVDVGHSFKTPAVTSNNSKPKSTQKDNISYVTVRNDNCRNAELRNSRIRQSSNRASISTLASVAEEQGAKQITCSSIGASENISQKDSQKTAELPLISGPIQSKSVDNNTSAQNKINLGLNQTVAENSIKMIESETQTDPWITGQYNEPIPMQQIQANIIEKLVKDTVSYEFDGIRQMMYLQQLSTMKYMDKNFMAANENTTNYDTLCKIIEKLAEENEQLKNIIAHHNM